MQSIARLSFRTVRTRPCLALTPYGFRAYAKGARPADGVSESKSKSSRVYTIIMAASAGLLFGMASRYVLSPVRLDAKQDGASTPSPNASKQIPFSEVQKHNTRESCWVIIDGQVYDATSILDTHPGGSAVLLKNSGKDATKAFIHIHRPGALRMLPPEAHLGPVDPATVPKPKEKRITQARAS